MLLADFIATCAVLGPAAAQDLPDGPGKETAAAVCGGCHDINHLRIGYTPPGQVDLKQWTVPTPGSRPHDPMAARDGSIWWTGQLANTLGRVDPNTRAIREFPLKSTNTGPHGLAEDKDGNVWFAGNSLGQIGKLDPNPKEYEQNHISRVAFASDVWFSDRTQTGYQASDARH